MIESVFLLLLGMGALVSALPSGGGSNDADSEGGTGSDASEDVVREDDRPEATSDFQELLVPDGSTLEESEQLSDENSNGTEEMESASNTGEQTANLVLQSGNGADILEGGDGDDTLISTDIAWMLPTANEEIGFYADDLPDTLVGGAGNDVIYAGPGDVVLTGEGADTVNAYEGNSVLSDLDVSEDNLRIYLPGGEVNGVDGTGSSYDLTGRVTVDATNSTLVSVLVDGVSVAEIPQQDGIVVAIVNTFDEEDYEIVFGSGAQLTDANVILSVFREISS